MHTDLPEGGKSNGSETLRGASGAPSSDSPDRSSQAAQSGDGALQNVALLLAYDGGPFQGWQIQRHGPSVQGSLEKAFRTILRREVKVYGSGRTDAGVHALNQVANVRLPAGIRLDKLRANLNGLLAPSVSVKELLPVPEAFHARHSARGKQYRYQLFNRPYPPVFGRGRAWWIKMPLDIPAMQAAARCLVGEHDFSAFRASQCAAPHPRRNLERLEVVPVSHSECTVQINLEAGGFLQHMARILAGTLVDAGQGKLTPDDATRILASRRRENASATAPANGLHLMSVRYDETQFPALRAWADC